MNSALLTIIVQAGIAFLVALLTIFLTPRLQHHFWRYQRRDELRLVAINEVNRLTAEFITEYIEAEKRRDKGLEPKKEFFQSFQAATAQVKALFSVSTFEVFKRMEVMIGPNLGPEHLHRSVDDFIQARDAALRALYEEVGVLPPGC